MNREQLQSNVPTVMGTGVGGIGGTVCGFLAANQFLSPTVELAPGIDVQPSIMTGDQGILATYKSTAMHAPNLSAHIPILPNAGIHLRVTKLDIPFDDRSLHTLASLAAQYHHAIGDPLQQALMERLALGAGVGMALGSLAAYTTVNMLRAPDRREWLHKPRRWPAIAATALSFLTGSSAIYAQASEAKPAHMLPLLSNGALVRYPELKDATISNPTDISPDLAVKISGYVGNINKFWRQSAQNLERSFATYEREGGMTIADNPKMISLMHLSDLHCDYPNYQNYLPRVLEKFRPDIIVSSGDTYSNSATMPYEKNCFHDFVGAVAAASHISGTNTKIINVAGNHDPKKPFSSDNPGIVTLNAANGYHANIDGIDFVGAPDQTVSTWGPTQPAEPAKRNELLAAQGSLVARVACDILYKTGHAPIVDVHNDAAGFEVADRGCASMIETGHTHTEKQVEKYVASNGRSVLQHTVGTASGSIGGLTFEQAAGRYAPVMMQYFNETTRQFVRFTTITLDTKTNVLIQTQKRVSKSTLPYTKNNVEAYLKDYSKTYAADHALSKFPH